MKKPTMKELASKIDAHLKRFEADKTGVNKDDKGNGKGLRPFFWAYCGFHGGNRISVKYISYQGIGKLTRDEAERYLAKLDAGFVGRHYEALRSK